MPPRDLNLSAPVSDSVKQTTCYMCACRCGIDVHFKDGKLRYIAGNADHPVNKGVLCGKGASGIMKQMSPAKLHKPLLRTGERGSNQFREIEWDEALEIATGWLANIRRTDPKRLAFFSGRDQSQALTGWWAEQFGTPNYAAHGGFCSVNMAAAGMYSIGGSFWEFGEADFDRTKLFVMFGVAEDHASNPIKLGIAKLKKNGARFVSVNPVRTGYSAVADQWLGIRPGTDGLLIGALIRELLLADRIDAEYLVRYTNAHWLVIQDPGAADDGLFARDAEGRPLCLDGANGRLADALLPDVAPRLAGEAVLPDGRRVVPAFQLMAARYLGEEYDTDAVAPRCDIDAATIRGLARELASVAFEQTITVETPWVDWTGRRHERFTGRPVSFHAMRGIAAHDNGFHTCRALHLLQMLLGAIDCPGGFRFKPPYPKPAPPAVKPGGDTAPNRALKGGPPLGYPTGPADLLLDGDGTPVRIDKAFSWDAPLAAHGQLHMLIANAWAGDPYPVDTLFLYMANMGWNSSMDVPATAKMLTDRDPATGDYRIPHIIYSDAFFSETVAYADLVLPDTTYLERHDCISLLDRPISDADGVADSIRQPVIDLDRDVRPFQSVLLDLGARLGLPGMTAANGTPLYADFADYMVRHERRPGIGMLAGWRGLRGDREGRGAPNPAQLDAYIANGCFWRHELAPEQQYFKHANKAYLDWAVRMGFLDRADPIVFQLYSEPLQKFRLAAEGHGDVVPPQDARDRVAAAFDPLPFWAPPGSENGDEGFPLHAITQRPMIMYHSWDSQNAWQRQILARNFLYMSRIAGEMQGLADGDWVWIESTTGRVRAQLRLMEGCNTHTVWTWNAVGKRAGAWNLAPDAPEATNGFLLNHLIPTHRDGAPNADPVTGQAAWYDLRVRLVKCRANEVTDDRLPALPALPGLPRRAKVRA